MSLIVAPVAVRLDGGTLYWPVFRQAWVLPLSDTQILAALERAVGASRS